ncbi:uncharacterized protein LOC116341153 isoform X2 [Contarinia nasturtii]|uniref:uncharacterized protein LOC116341153 isoform X2 n=1 Tax=Contarinia nasturtii TaxID=265458 RepID=UPI0012D47C9D|nr:uncharacterized protein LOC116341153 isoform X2 [Contarinia nasturtii]
MFLFEQFKTLKQVSHYAKYTRKWFIKAALDKQQLQEQFDLVCGCVMSALKNRKSLSVSEFKKIEEELRSKCNELKKMQFYQHVFNVLFTLRPPNDSIENAKSFVEAFNIKNDLNVKKNFIRLYTQKALEFELTEKEEKELVYRCDELIARKIKNCKKLSAVIALGLCATKDWHRAIELPNLTHGPLNILAQRALNENDIDSAFKITHRTITLNKWNPTCIPSNTDKLFSLCEKLNMQFNEPSIKELVNVLERHGHHAKTTNINLSGTCNMCKNQLEVVRTLTNAEFNILQTEFMNNVVKGADIYQNTTPEEWDSFEQMIQKNGPFDIVIDGLNVSYQANLNNVQANGLSKLSLSNDYYKSPCSYSLADAAKQLIDEGRRVLVIGKKHMKVWSTMEDIRQIATVFLVENDSNDDIFLLYAAIYSGENACILTRDHMRNHKHAIGEEYDELFKLWQQEHWYSFEFSQSGSIELVKPIQYKMYIHKVDEFWHVPFEAKDNVVSNIWKNYELPENWACIRIKDNFEC